MLRHMLPGPKQPRPLPKPYGTNPLSTMGYLRRSCQIKAKTLKVIWWLTSVSWWGCKRYGPAHTIHKLMANVRDSTPLWLVCWECYPQRRNQSGRTTLEHWFMPIIVPKISYKVQPLLPHVWKTTLPHGRCYPWLITTHNNSTKHLLICAKDEGMCKMSSEKGWSLQS